MNFNEFYWFALSVQRIETWIELSFDDQTNEFS